MKQLVYVAALLVLTAPSGSAQDIGVVYQKEETFQFKLDALARGEWTRDIFVSTTSTRHEDRTRFQARPAILGRFGSLSRQAPSHRVLTPRPPRA